ncbi:MAG: hypothetical protein GF335_04040 [Candidatus Moranbacteria bacterium]|nr:hypothetical protein [Candidatus Moranbacteria bacterium]
MRKKIISAYQKANIALEAFKEAKSINQLGSIYKVDPNIISKWKKTLKDNAPSIFQDKRKNEFKEYETKIEELYKIIGKRDSELEWLKKNLHIKS